MARTVSVVVDIDTDAALEALTDEEIEEEYENRFGELPPESFKRESLELIYQKIVSGDKEGALEMVHMILKDSLGRAL